MFLPHKKVRGQKKKPSFNGGFYRKNVLKPLLKEVNRRTEDTDDLLTTDLFEYEEWVFQQDGAKPILRRPP